MESFLIIVVLLVFSVIFFLSYRQLPLAAGAAVQESKVKINAWEKGWLSTFENFAQLLIGILVFLILSLLVLKVVHPDLLLMVQGQIAHLS